MFLNSLLECLATFQYQQWTTDLNEGWGTILFQFTNSLKKGRMQLRIRPHRGKKRAPSEQNVSYTIFQLWISTWICHKSAVTKTQVEPPQRRHCTTPLSLPQEGSCGAWHFWSLPAANQERLLDPQARVLPTTVICATQPLSKIAVSWENENIQVCLANKRLYHSYYYWVIALMIKNQRKQQV